ncbi:MAG: SRPBCC family protein [bacterium]
MPRVNRSRLIPVPIERVWEVVSDPHHLPRWWPRAVRVEDVRVEEGEAVQWTTVLGTEKGGRVRADYRRTGGETGRSLAWSQGVAGTPFERILKSAAVEIELEPEGEGSRVTLAVNEVLRGISRLGSPLMRGAAKRRLDEALANLDHALVGAR